MTVRPIQEIKNEVAEAIWGDCHGDTLPFIARFREIYGDQLLAVITYGSCLSDCTRSKTSVYDFFLIADNYSKFHKKWLHSRINKLMPPAVFSMELETEPGRRRACKYCVITMEDLEVQTSHRAKDLYLLGRFSKRVRIDYSRGDWVSSRIADLMVNAWQVLAPHALAAAPTHMTCGDFAKSLLKLSYLGEVRLEKTDEKVDALYHAQKEFYDQFLREILEIYIAGHRDLFKVGDDLPEGQYQQRRTPALRAQQYKKLDRLIRKSRRRAKMRWPLMILTVDRWVDILLAKLERTYGEKLELAPWERRWILIFGWRHYLRLRKNGKIR